MNAEVSLRVLLTRRGALPPAVLLDGTPVEAGEDGDYWRYLATPAVDTLRPRFEVELETQQGLRLTLPFVTRNGTAVWRPGGDLELPVRYLGPETDPHLGWRVRLTNDDGMMALTIDSNGVPLRSPIVVPAALVPPGTTIAEITASLDQQTDEASFPVAVSVRSTVRLRIPEGG